MSFNVSNYTQMVSEYVGYAKNQTAAMWDQVTTSDAWNQASEQVAELRTNYLDAHVNQVSTLIMENQSIAAPVAGLACGYLTGRAAVNKDVSIKKALLQIGAAYLILYKSGLSEVAGSNPYVTLSMIGGAGLAIAQQRSSKNITLKA